MRRAAIVGFALALATLGAAPTTALGSVHSEQRAGARALEAFESEGRDCGALDDEDFHVIGEYVMGRMAGSPRAHAAMNSMMAAMMGEDAEEQMHEFLGRRFTGCGGGRLPGGFGGMMGAMGMMGGGPGGLGRFGQSGGPGGGPAFPQGMMGDGFFDRGDRDADGGWDDAVLTMFIFTGLLLLAVVVGLLLWRPWRAAGGPRPRSAIHILDERLARGEIEREDYERRRAALEKR